HLIHQLRRDETVDLCCEKCDGTLEQEDRQRREDDADAECGSQEYGHDPVDQRLSVKHRMIAPETAVECTDYADGADDIDESCRDECLGDAAISRASLRLQPYAEAVHLLFNLPFFTQHGTEGEAHHDDEDVVALKSHIDTED